MQKGRKKTGTQASLRHLVCLKFLLSSQESDSDSDDLTTFPGSGIEHGRGVSSSSQPVTPPLAQSHERDVRGDKVKNTQPGITKCDRTVQTYIEKPQDCDEYYFMSLVKMFKRLSPQKKADVRMKIERLLFEAECE